MADDELIEQILQGNRDIYRELVSKYQSMLFRTCMGFLHNKEDAEDLTQEIFIQIYQSLPKFRGESSFSTWIYRIAVNAALNKIRKESKSFWGQRFESFLGGEKQEMPEIPIPVNENPENILIQAEHREWIQRALNSLPENQRTAIVLSKYDDLSQKEIAQIMNITEGAVEALMQRGKANLRQRLSSFSKKSKK